MEANNKLIYKDFKGKQLTVNEIKELNMEFYYNLTSYRYLLKDIVKMDIKYILKSILESNSNYFVVGYDQSDMDSTLVFGKVELVRILIKHNFRYGLGYIDYEDYLLYIDIAFDSPVEEFNNAETIEVYLSYDDMAKIIPYITMDKALKEYWENIKHWWKQKEMFKALD